MRALEIHISILEGISGLLACTSAMQTVLVAAALSFAPEGALLQSRAPDEVIVIDDCSADDSVEILRSYEGRFPTLRVLVNERNRGVLANAETLLGLARGRYFYAAAADDMILPGFFEKSLEILERFPEAGLCSTRSLIVGQDGCAVASPFPSWQPFQRKSEPYFVNPIEARRQLFRQGSWMQGNTVIFRRQALIAAGGFLPRLGSYTDGFIHEVLALRHGACFIPESLAAWRKLPESYSASTGKNPAAMRAIYDEALRCMAEDYRGLFSASYIYRWRNRWNGGALLALHRAKEAEFKAAFRQFLPEDSRASWFARKLASLGIFFSRVFICVTAATLLWFDLPMLLCRRIGRLWYSN